MKTNENPEEYVDVKSTSRNLAKKYRENLELRIADLNEELSRSLVEYSRILDEYSRTENGKELLLDKYKELLEKYKTSERGRLIREAFIYDLLADQVRLNPKGFTKEKQFKEMLFDEMEYLINSKLLLENKKLKVEEALLQVCKYLYNINKKFKDLYDKRNTEKSLEIMELVEEFARWRSHNKKK